jgi:hypothetical protein
MFKEIGQMIGLMRNLPKIKDEVGRFQERLGQVSAEGDAGGGMVRVRFNGRMEMVACQLSDEAVKMGDREMLEDLIRSATNQALERVRKLVAEETSKMAAGLGLPADMALPGIS